VRHTIDFSLSDKAAPDRFVHRLLQLAPVYVAAPQQIHDRPQRTRDPHSMHFLNVAGIEMRPVQDKNFRNSDDPLEDVARLLQCIG
jgi:hypothetical protein